MLVVAGWGFAIVVGGGALLELLDAPVLSVERAAWSFWAFGRLPVLGIYGSHRAAYKLSKSFQILFIDSLSSSRLSLERLCLSLAPLPQRIWGRCV